MRIEALHIGQKVKHPQYGVGVVKAITEHSAEVRFGDAIQRTVAPEVSGLAPAEAHAEVSGLSVPLNTLIKQTVEAAVDALGIEKPQAVVEQLANRWRRGRLVLHTNDPTQTTKELELEVFFHKIVMVRNQLRVLEQKINAHEKLSEAEKVEWQQYITRCYGSLTTFNVLFKSKEDQF
jgi:hypothetical protein